MITKKEKKKKEMMSRLRGDKKNKDFFFLIKRVLDLLINTQYFHFQQNRLFINVKSVQKNLEKERLLF